MGDTMIRLLAGVGVCAVAAATWAANPPAAVPTPEALVAGLGSADFAAREAATRALETAGPPAIPALEAALQHPSPEVSRRAAGVLAKLRRAEDSRVLLAPKTVRLAYKNVPLGAAAGDLKVRTGVNVVLDPAGVTDPSRAVTCETAALPVWEAVTAFCRAAGLREVYAADLPVPKPEPRARRTYYAPPPPPAADGVPVRLADGPPDALPGNRATAVRVLALPRAFPGHAVTLGTGEVTLCFDVTPLPGLHWQEVAGVRVTKLIDDAGRVGTGGAVELPEAPANDAINAGVVFFNGGGRNVVMRWDDNGNPLAPSSHPNPRVVPVPLKLATPAARSLRRLEGVVVCELAVPDQPLVTIDAPAGHVGAAFEGAGGVKATVLGVAPGAGGRTAVRVRVDAPSAWTARRRLTPWGPLWPDQAQSTRGVYRATAADAAGKPVAVTCTLSDLNDDGSNLTTVVQMTAAGPPPARLTLVGVRPTTVEVPFAMENVPLP